jgi:hypothetical protein
MLLEGALEGVSDKSKMNQWKKPDNNDNHYQYIHRFKADSTGLKPRRTRLFFCKNPLPNQPRITAKPSAPQHYR